MPVEKERKENKRRGNGWKGEKEIKYCHSRRLWTFICIFISIVFLCIVQLNIILYYIILYYILYIFYLLMKHAPSLESNTTCCELVGNAGPAPIRVPSLHFLYIVFLRLYNVLSLALLLLEFLEIY